MGDLNRNAEATEETPLLSSVSGDEEKRSWAHSVQAELRNSLGLIQIAGSQLLAVLGAAAAAYLQRLPESSISGLELVFVRFSMTAICTHIWIRWRGEPHPLIGPPGIRLIMLLRGVLGFCNLCVVYYIVRYLPFSDAVVLSFFDPFVIGILGYYILGEPYRPIEAVAAVVSMIGVLLLAKPAALFPNVHVDPVLVDGKPVSDAQRLLAIGVAFIGCFISAFVYLVIRFIGHRATSGMSIQYGSVVGAVLACFGPILSPKTERWFWPSDKLQASLLLFTGIAGYLGILLLVKGIRREKAARGSLITFLGVPFSMLSDKIIFNRTMDTLSIIGTLIILTSVLVTFLTKAKATQEPIVAITTVEGEEDILDEQLPPETAQFVAMLAEEDAMLARVTSRPASMMSRQNSQRSHRSRV